MDLNISGETLSVKIADQSKLILKQNAKQHFETERKTENGIEKISVQLKTVNSVITSAQLTVTIVPNDERREMVWWAVTARNSDDDPVI
jgi:hypothetical protein